MFVDISSLSWLFTALYTVSVDEEGVDKLPNDQPLRWFYRQQLGWAFFDIGEHPLIVSLDLGAIMYPAVAKNRPGAFYAGLAF